MTKQADYVEYCGYVSSDEKVIILYNSDILFPPSYEEGLAIVLMEAMAAGCAVVTTDVGANLEIFSEKNGYVLKPGDVGGLLNAFEALDADRARLGKISLYNSNKSKKYTIEKFIEELLRHVCDQTIDQYFKFSLFKTAGEQLFIIKNGNDLKHYLEQDRLALRKTRKRPKLFGNEI